MISEKKMHINKSEIEYLGMNIKEGKYSPGLHITEKLLEFPNADLTKKDFIPEISRYIIPLTKMLKKNPPIWSTTQTKAIQILKEKLQHMSALQIPFDGKRILQTDASDKHWGAILFEELERKRHICGCKSGRFIDAELHYHSTFKEILAVKNGISKFEFHLIGYHFLVEMVMSSFPQMLEFKQKTVPHPQLLRWAEWFSKYSFDVKHIKGKTNVLADLLTRPTKEVMAFRTFQPRPIMMFRPVASSSSKNSVQAFPIPPNLNPEFPPEVMRLVEEKTVHQKTRDMMFEYQLLIFRNFL
ncbi:polyprotein [Gossypium australe]|uniref:Polyprotein n=1 Tax=Gossypium australe TaxID=47621 RepID=A0A5B6WE79_9ROSI|nr:polyprotein [Gossypium australe]